jgi:hypothetical protein
MEELLSMEIQRELEGLKWAWATVAQRGLALAEDIFGDGGSD